MQTRIQNEEVKNVSQNITLIATAIDKESISALQTMGIKELTLQHAHAASSDMLVISHEIFQDILSLKGLEQLTLENVLITQPIVDLIKKSSLKKLIIHKKFFSNHPNTLVDEALAIELFSLKQLTNIEISYYNTNNSFSKKIFDAIISNPSITTIKTKLPPKDFHYWKKTSLTTLSIHSGLDSLLKQKEITAPIKSLYIAPFLTAHKDHDDQYLSLVNQLIEKLPHLINLTVEDLSSAKDIASMAHLKNVKRLSLSFYKYLPLPMETIKELSKLPGLYALTCEVETSKPNETYKEILDYLMENNFSLEILDLRELKSPQQGRWYTEKSRLTPSPENLSNTQIFLDRNIHLKHEKNLILLNYFPKGLADIISDYTGNFAEENHAPYPSLFSSQPISDTPLKEPQKNRALSD